MTKCRLSVAYKYADKIHKITNSAPSHTVLGTLNGLAQTLSAAGRAVGPFLSGGLFSLAVRLFTTRDEDGNWDRQGQIKASILAFGVFAAVSLVGLVLSLGISNAAGVPGAAEDAEMGVSDSEDDELEGHDERDGWNEHGRSPNEGARGR